MDAWGGLWLRERRGLGGRWYLFYEEEKRPGVSEFCFFYAGRSWSRYSLGDVSLVEQE